MLGLAKIVSVHTLSERHHHHHRYHHEPMPMPQEARLDTVPNECHFPTPLSPQDPFRICRTRPSVLHTRNNSGMGIDQPVTHYPYLAVRAGLSRDQRLVIKQQQNRKGRYRLY